MVQLTFVEFAIFVSGSDENHLGHSFLEKLSDGVNVHVAFLGGLHDQVDYVFE